MSTQPTRRAITDQEVAKLAEAIHRDRDTKYDVGRMVTLRIRERKTYAEIGEIIGCDAVTVSKHIEKFTKWVEDPDALAAYREHKPDFFEGVELKIMSLLHERLNDPTYKPSVKDLANAMKVFVEMRRLETGQSTDNVAVFVKSIEQAHKNLFPVVQATDVKDTPTNEPVESHESSHHLETGC